MTITINGRRIVPVIALVHYRNNVERRAAAYWNCGWHVGEKVYSHATFGKVFQIVLERSWK